MRVSKLRKLNPSAVGTCTVVLVPPLTIGKWRNGDILKTPLRSRHCRQDSLCTIQSLRNSQRRIALTLAFTSEKWNMTLKNVDCTIGNWFRIFSQCLCQSLYDVNQRRSRRCVGLTAQLAIRYLITGCFYLKFDNFVRPAWTPCQKRRTCKFG